MTDDDDDEDEEDEASGVLAALRPDRKRALNMTLIHMILGPDLLLSEMSSVLYKPDSTLGKSKLSSALPFCLNRTFLEDLHRILLEDVQGLLNTIEKLQGHIDPDKAANSFIKRSSILGFFLRRICISFDCLSFSEVSKLYHKMKSWIGEGLDRFKRLSLPDNQMVKV